MPLLSSLVFLGVICSRCCEQHHCLHRDFSTSKTTALPPLPLPLLRSDHRLHHRKKYLRSTFLWNFVYIRPPTRPHAPPEVSASQSRTSSFRHAPSRAATRYHALPRVMRTSIDTHWDSTNSIRIWCESQLTRFETQQSILEYLPKKAKIQIFDRTLTQRL